MLERTDPALPGELRALDNHDAWQRFIDSYYGLIYGCCRGNGLDPDEARDLTVVVLEKLKRVLPDFTYRPGEKPGRFRAWLRKVTTNAVADHARRPKPPGLVGVGNTDALERLHQVPFRSAADLERVSESIEEALAEKELERMLLLREAMRRVRERLRNPKRWEALWGILEGRSSREVADQLGWSVAAVLVAAKEVQDMLKEEVAKIQQEEADGANTQDPEENAAEDQ
jgi:RNA polymerase sigma factor (sigma-70 family)